MNAHILYNEAKKLGLRLRPKSDKLAVSPATRCPLEFAAKLLAHKEELLALLNTKGAGLNRQESPWLHVAKQVLAGEFDGLDTETRRRLLNGLESSIHALCRRAIKRLVAPLR